MKPAERAAMTFAGLRHDEPMSAHTSLRVGGPADVYFKPENETELIEFLVTLPAQPTIHWTGLGSNLLVRDGGLRGVVINPSRALAALHRRDGGVVEAGAGVPCTVLARACARWRLGPAAFFAGIPGTVGGALAMNAGAFGGETWDNVVDVETIDRSGAKRRRPKSDFTIDYRQVGRPEGEWFSRAWFQMAAQPEDSSDQVRALMQERKEKQPLGLPSCGSVFRNPPGGHAAALIEKSGLKGCRIGGAQVSEKHANFIINVDQASAADVERLIEHVRSTVRDAHGIELVPEVHIVGEAATEAAR